MTTNNAFRTCFELRMDDLEAGCVFVEQIYQSYCYESSLALAPVR